MDGQPATRPYDPDADRAALWSLKAAFERELGAGTGDEAKATRYEGKLTPAYRDRYLSWVDRCVADDPRCVTVVEGGPAPGEEDEGGRDAGGEETATGGQKADGQKTGADGREAGTSGQKPDADGGKTDADGRLAGYVFVLPADLAMIWDAAVLNEIYVRPPDRGTGAADALMAAAVALARDQDPPLARLVLDVDRANDRARAFYRRHGFEHWGEMVARPLCGRSDAVRGR